MRAHLAIVLIELRRLAESAGQETVAGETGHVARLLAEIDARLAGEISLDALASSLGLTPGYLTSEVRRISGRTAMQWVTARRLRAAQKLLVETDAPIAEVAAAVGFVDGSHFARRFREEFGTSPGLWRKGMKRATRTANGT
jgi:AraC-like DNA-binding protein